jgi:hypothetical protein
VFDLFQAIKQREKTETETVCLESWKRWGERGERTNETTNGKEKERNNGKDAEGNQPAVGRKINQE